MSRVYVGLGANLGDLRATLQSALADLAAWPGLTLVAVSSAYRSAPVGCDGPDFLNAVAQLETDLAPLAVLEALLSIEQQHGRERPFPNAPRTLDLDLLLHGDAQLDTPRLTVPHPRLHQRAFVLRPLLELDPTLTLPGLGTLVAQLGALSEQALMQETAPLAPTGQASTFPR